MYASDETVIIGSRSMQELTEKVSRSVTNERDMSNRVLRDLLSKKVPPAALDYCVGLWEQQPFHFKLRRKRVTKLGDYRYDPQDKSHTITVNHDLNQYQFLITYVHEVAHRVVHRPLSRQKPHGPHWKSKFRDLMLPLLNTAVFPEDVLRALARHMRNPKASTAGDPVLVSLLAQYDPKGSSMPTLAEVGLGVEFIFRKRAFKKLEKKRTRALCLDLSNQKKYLIPELAEVKILNGSPSLFQEEPIKPALTLKQVAQGQEFVFRKRTFRKLEKKRTRAVCLDLGNQQRYLISERAEVERVSA